MPKIDPYENTVPFTEPVNLTEEDVGEILWRHSTRHVLTAIGWPEDDLEAEVERRMVNWRDKAEAFDAWLAERREELKDRS
ncbi:hypothetical protein [Pseudohoeflea coraliihabitans]|uniref:Uncharacterized protein n=1 Tax=Pseudohoeflea coraliihabitans TaxID=2860393 RepID=A0ABS6WTF2_9HYPH|nr:hypothetical protein [Pseudohoeflea sp. DP4N28-3]MBW3099242.1 hypothetical protein [Pseudohoeflea sp. DP4N28-3]